MPLIERAAQLALFVGCVSACDRPKVIVDYWLFPHYATPSCELSREHLVRRHVVHGCWKWKMSRPVRLAQLSPSCLLDQDGVIECWRDALKDPPEGRFVSIDDNGVRACALDDRGKVHCWGNPDRPWVNMPDTFKFTAISVGRGGSPWHVGADYACGLTSDQHVLCWETGPQGQRAVLPGSYTQLEAGDGTVCAVATSGKIRCLAGVLTPPLRDPPPVDAVSVSLQHGTRCYTDAKRVSTCWSGSLDAERRRLADTKSLRALEGGVCVLHEDGRLECAGDPRPPPDLKFHVVSRPSEFDAICGLAFDGNIYCWGNPQF